MSVLQSGVGLRDRNFIVAPFAMYYAYVVQVPLASMRTVAVGKCLLLQCSIRDIWLVAAF